MENVFRVFANGIYHPGGRCDHLNLDENTTLTEWDFDIPRDNRFHDPIQPNDKKVKCSQAPAESRVVRPSTEGSKNG